MLGIISASASQLFQDVTVQARLDHLAPESPPAIAPNCLFDEIEGGLTIERESIIADGQRPDVFLQADGTATDFPGTGSRERRQLLNLLGLDHLRSVVVDHGVLCQIERNGGGAAADDIDGDGWSDIVLSGPGAPTLLRNRGDGSFDDVTNASGVLAAWRRAGLRAGRSNGVAFFDCDNDGDADLFVSTLGGKQNFLFINTDGAGTYSEQAAARGVAQLGDSGGHAVRTAGTGIAVGDYDGDGL